MGVRLALGASGGRVTAHFARGAIALAGIGGVVGAGASWLFVGVLRRLSVDAPPLDPWTVAGAMLVLAAASVAATVVPAHRAARVDPLSTLRVE